MTTTHDTPSPEQILEARELMMFGAQHAACPADEFRFNNSYVTLNWVSGCCDCGCREQFEKMLIRLRAQRDQCEAAKGGFRA